MEELLKWATQVQHVAILTGAGMSAASGVATFRGSGGVWESVDVMELASPQGFQKNPLLVWRFYDHRRQELIGKTPNPGHEAITGLQRTLRDKGRQLTVVTQNVDGLHEQSGTKDVICLHGQLWRVRCTKCGVVSRNTDVPIAPGLSEGELPKCGECGGLLRPHIVWFGEALNPHHLEDAVHAASSCGLFVVAGTSAVVHPAAGLIEMARRAGAVVVEVNPEPTDGTEHCDFVFREGAEVFFPRFLSAMQTRL